MGGGYETEIGLRGPGSRRSGTPPGRATCGGWLDGPEDDLAVALDPLGAGDQVGNLERAGTSVHRPN